MDGYIGEIKLFAGNFAPRNWELCDGRLLPIKDYQPLFTILLTVHGGDGVSNFALPKLNSLNDVNYFICVNGEFPER